MSARNKYVGCISGRPLDEPLVDDQLFTDVEPDSVVRGDGESIVTLRNVDPPHPAHREIVRARAAGSAWAAIADVEAATSLHCRTAEARIFSPRVCYPVT